MFQLEIQELYTISLSCLINNPLKGDKFLRYVRSIRIILAMLLQVGLMVLYVFQAGFFYCSFAELLTIPFSHSTMHCYAKPEE